MLYKLFVKEHRDLVVELDCGELDYFNEYFNGRRMAATWSAPPLIVERNHKPVRDFLSCSALTVPIVTERVLEVLGENLETHCEAFKLATIKRRTIYALNVVALIDNAKDFDPSGPGMFKLASEPSGNVFVSQAFVDLVIERKLYGAGFVPPPFEDWYVGSPQIFDLDHFIHDETLEDVQNLWRLKSQTQ